MRVDVGNLAGAEGVDAVVVVAAERSSRINIMLNRLVQLPIQIANVHHECRERPQREQHGGDEVFWRPFDSSGLVYHLEENLQEW